MTTITEEEFLLWLEDPVTGALRDWASRSKMDLMEQWASGRFTDQVHFGAAVKNAEAIGRCAILDQIVEIDFEQLKEDE
jgi:hypothetical protein